MHGSSEVKMIAMGHDELFSGTTRCAHELRTPGGEVGPPSYAAPQASPPETPECPALGGGDWKNLGFCRVVCPLVGGPVTENDPGFFSVSRTQDKPAGQCGCWRRRGGPVSVSLSRGVEERRQSHHTCPLLSLPCHFLCVLLWFIC